MGPGAAGWPGRPGRAGGWRHGRAEGEPARQTVRSAPPAAAGLVPSAITVRDHARQIEPNVSEPWRPSFLLSLSDLTAVCAAGPRRRSLGRRHWVRVTGRRHPHRPSNPGRAWVRCGSRSFSCLEQGGRSRPRLVLTAPGGAACVDQRLVTRVVTERGQSSATEGRGGARRWSAARTGRCERVRTGTGGYGREGSSSPPSDTTCSLRRRARAGPLRSDHPVALDRNRAGPGSSLVAGLQFAPDEAVALDVVEPLTA